MADEELDNGEEKEVNELLEQCKIHFGIVDEAGDFDDVLEQKIEAVKRYMARAGIEEENMDPEAIFRGVADIWDAKSGEATFSPLFINLVAQLRG